MKKDFKYYNSLKYALIVQEHMTEEGIEFSVHTNELDQLTFYGTGRTVEEAIKDFNETKSTLFEIYLEEHIPIPEPDCDEEDLPSGNFIVRTSPKTHRKLLDCSKKNKQSLNAFVNALLAYACAKNDFLELAKIEISNITKEITEKPTERFITMEVEITSSKNDKNLFEKEYRIAV